jgi:hypothetical protein
MVGRRIRAGLGCRPRPGLATSGADNWSTRALPLRDSSLSRAWLCPAGHDRRGQGWLLPAVPIEVPCVRLSETPARDHEGRNPVG